MSSIAATLAGSPARRQQDTAKGRLLVTYVASGGWDTTAFCDPKYNHDLSSGLGPMSHYEPHEVRQAGNIRYAPAAKGFDTSRELNHTLDTFFHRFHREMVVVNGIAVGTTSHQDGKKLFGSGSDQGKLPCISGLMAAQGGFSSFISYGAYEQAVKGVRRQQIGFRQPAFDIGFHKDEFVARRASHQQILSLVDDEVSQSHLMELLGDPNPSPCELVAAAFAIGKYNSANIVGGSFDSHSDNDRIQNEKYLCMLKDLTTLWDMAEYYGFADRLTVYVCSDFGRAPYYNSAAGKEHYPVSSAFVMDRNIEGNKVIQATNDRLELLPMNTRSLQVDENNGGIITGAHLHSSLRQWLGIDESTLSASHQINPQGHFDFFRAKNWVDI